MRNAKLAEALEALPEKKLGRFRMYDHETDCYCAVGAMMLHRGCPEKTASGFTDAHNLIDMTPDEIWKLSVFNDDVRGTEEARHAYMLAYAKEEV